MQRFILSAFSVLLVTAALTPTAQALPKVDSDFNFQALRLSELDARNKSDEGQQPYYPQTYTTPQAWPQNAAAEQESAPTAESTVWEPSDAEAVEALEKAPSVTERRHQLLDRN